MATAVSDVASARRDYMDESGGRYVHVICDGGMANGGDIAKAVACGADAVMIGMPLATGHRGARAAAGTGVPSPVMRPCRVVPGCTWAAWAASSRSCSARRT